jgi:hypothetical protein
LAWTEAIPLAFINDVRDRAARGQRYAAGDVGDDLVPGHRFCFVDVPLARYGDYLGMAIWFYAKSPRPFPACNWCGRTRRDDFRGRRRSIRN